VTHSLILTLLFVSDCNVENVNCYKNLEICHSIEGHVSP
jgi:hypothetical protein